MKKVLFPIVAVLGLLVLANSCKKAPTTVVTTLPAGLAPNLHIIDSTQWIQNLSHPDRIALGYYDYSFKPGAAYVNIQAGDIILGSTGEGYLRKVINVSMSSTTLTLRTVQASLSDVFKGGNFNFDMDMNGMNNSAVGFSDSFSNVKLYQSANADERLATGSFSMSPNWHFTMAFDTNGITNFGVSTSNAAFNCNHTYTFGGTAAFSVTQTTSIGSFTKTSVQYVTVGDVKVPVVVTMAVDLSAKSVGWANGIATNNHETFAGSGIFNLGLQYSGGVWQSNYSLSPSSTLGVGVATPGPGSVWRGNVSIAPKVSIKLYGIDCAYGSLGMDGSMQTAYTQGNWDFVANGWYNSSAGATPTILGPHVGTCNYTWSSDTIGYQTPYTAIKDSGDAQSGTVTNPLPDKLVVRVLDSYGNPQANVPVLFTPAVSCGSFSPAVAVTDANGFARTIWTLGTVHGNQSVSVSIKDGHNAAIIATPLTFTAFGI